VPRDAHGRLPQIDIPVVTVIWSSTGLSTPEMEQRVTTYSQYAISSNVNGIKDIEAQTMAGLSVQKIYFQPDVNLDLADRNLPRPAKGIT
jgi:multidrug efflux pump subunit AcrB